MSLSDCFLGLTPYTLIMDVDGSDIAETYPSIQRITTFTFDQNLGILGMQFSSSLTNTEADLMGLFVLVGAAARVDVITLDSAVNQGIWISHLSNLNAVPGFASPSSRSTTIGFGESGIHLQAGDPVSIFGCCGPSADNLMAGVLNIYTILSS